MSRTKPRQILVPLLAIVALASAITIALAGPPAQGPPSSEPDSHPPTLPGTPAGDEGAPDRDGYAGIHEQRPFAGEASETGPQWTTSQSVSVPPAGTQPDEDGYTGERTPVGAVAIPPSEGGLAQAPPDWDSLLAEPQPDQDAFYEKGDVALQQWSTFRYVHVAGTALRPRDSSVQWEYAGYGCVRATVGTDKLNIHLELPDGSRVDYLRLYYYDATASSSRAWFTSYDNAGSYADIVTVASTGESGYGTALSVLSGQVIDTAANSYVLNWGPAVAGAQQWLCGLRVAYRVPE
jgi:hypothetical protein